MNAVVHAAAIPDPTHNPPATVFQNNLMATFNVLEAAVRLGGIAVREHLERDGAGVLLPGASLPAGLRARR